LLVNNRALPRIRFHDLRHAHATHRSRASAWALQGRALWIFTRTLCRACRKPLLLALTAMSKA
jgi:hypothetical protein